MQLDGGFGSPEQAGSDSLGSWPSKGEDRFRLALGKVRQQCGLHTFGDRSRGNRRNFGREVTGSLCCDKQCQVVHPRDVQRANTVLGDGL